MHGSWRVYKTLLKERVFSKVSLNKIYVVAIIFVYHGVYNCHNICVWESSLGFSPYSVNSETHKQSVNMKCAILKSTHTIM